LVGPLATDGQRLEENGLSSRVVGVDLNVLKGLLGALIGGTSRSASSRCRRDGLAALGMSVAGSLLSALEWLVWWRAYSRTRSKRDHLGWRFGLVTPGLAVLAAVCASVACLLDLVLLGLAMDSEAVRFGTAWYMLLLASTAGTWYAADALVTARFASQDGEVKLSGPDKGGQL
jgi:peptidoglycan biosynthesis protein MviN/MurJ (putative lipid II flippase)